MLVLLANNSLKPCNVFSCHVFIFNRNLSNVKDESNESSKEKFIMLAWVRDFPAQSNLSYQDVSSLASRSNNIGNWFSKVNEEFIAFITSPEWVKDEDTLLYDWTPEVQDLLLEAKKMSADLSASKNRISKGAGVEMELANRNYRDGLIKLFEGHPELIINFYSTNMLSNEVHFKALEYSTKEEAKEFLRKELVNFQHEKLKEFKSGNLTTTDLIDLLHIK
jgi:hypothetical protein